MPGQNNPSPTPSPFEIVTPGKSKKAGNKGIIIAVVIAVFLILSVIAGVLLVRQQQNVQEQASNIPPAGQCPGAGACPDSSQKTLLRDCYPAQGDNTPQDSTCNVAGRVEPCGPVHTKYCCPSVGGNWTTTMTAACQANLSSPSPTASPTPSPTATPSPTPTATPNSCGGTCGSDANCQSGFICSGGFCRNPLCTLATNCNCGGATATPTATPAPTSAAQSSPLPVPVTGTDWPTVAGVGVGTAAIVVSILLAL